jgi:hypothetical protein
MTGGTKVTIAGFALALAAALVVALTTSAPPRDLPTQHNKEIPEDFEQIAQALPPDGDLPLRATLVREMPTGLAHPGGLALTAEGNYVVVGAEGVAVLAPGGKKVASWSTQAPARGVAVAPDGSLYVGVQTGVFHYTAGGDLLAQWGEAGRGPGQFSVVTSLAVWHDVVLVADSGNRCIHRFRSDGSYLDEIGRRSPDKPDEGIVCRSNYLDIAVDDEAAVHVTNNGRLRVDRYRQDGVRLGSWGESGIRPHQFIGCCNPTNIALMGEGRTVVSEKGIARVKVYDENGRMLCYIGPKNFAVDAAGLDLAVDAQGRVIVVDPGSGAIKVFELSRTEGETDG